MPIAPLAGAALLACGAGLWALWRSRASRSKGIDPAAVDPLDSEIARMEAQKGAHAHGVGLMQDEMDLELEDMEMEAALEAEMLEAAAADDAAARASRRTTAASAGGDGQQAQGAAAAASGDDDAADEEGLDPDELDPEELEELQEELRALQEEQGVMDSVEDAAGVVCVEAGARSSAAAKAAPAAVAPEGAFALQA